MPDLTSLTGDFEILVSPIPVDLDAAPWQLVGVLRACFCVVVEAVVALAT